MRLGAEREIEVAEAAGDEPENRIAFQGELGAYSHQACREVFPHMSVLPSPTFEEAIAAVRNGSGESAARLVMLPVENSIYGRVADIHHLLPESGLYIIAEHFVPVRINVLGVAGAKLSEVKEAQSHTVLLGQCRRYLKDRGLAPIVGADTAGSAKEVAERGDPGRVALASALAGEIHGLQSLDADIQDHDHNTTRFIVMSRQRIEADRSAGPAMTAFVFQVRNVAAALYKAMGGFATNGVNMVKLESYMVGGSFTATRFYAEIEGHPDDDAVFAAMEELGFYTSYLKVLGAYPAHPFRSTRS